MCQSKWMFLRFTPCHVWCPSKVRSILGLLPFILYINDHLNTLSSALLYLFADDTRCLHTGSAQFDQTHYYRMTSMHYLPTVVHGTCSSMILNVYIFTFILTPTPVFLHTTSTTQKIQESFSILAYVGTNTTLPLQQMLQDSQTSEPSEFIVVVTSSQYRQPSTVDRLIN